MTWEELQGKFRKSMSPPVAQELARPFAPSHSLGQTNGMPQPYFTHDAQEMDIDSNPSDEPQQPQQPQQQQQQHVGLPSLSDARNRTPLPGGRLEKSLSLPGIESLKNDLQSNVSRMLSTGARTRYQSVEALLIFWEHDDDFSTVNGAVKELADVFDQFYHYTFKTLLIPSPSESCKSSGRWLSRKLNDFVEDRDQRDVLKIVFYAGHSYLDGNRDMTLASSKDTDKASTIRWSAIQQILEEACSDVLILMDAAYYPSSKMVRNRGVLELIAASVSEEHHHVLDRCSYTRALAGLLRTRATRLSPLSAAELHAALLAAYPKLVQERHPEKETITSFPAPLHIMMSGNPRLPSIFLAPVYQGSPLRNSSLGGYDNNPQLHLSIRLNDDNVDVETWNEWLRLMPDGIKDVRVEGPFRPTYR
ncbi:hypothetical protein NLU13_5451 [Sarocladium strictum]|uniref:Uncharacterized protein n=1 Tax=Sarocladium strictum TaxID=5046 RepID=A0AA39L7M7_SARSR|nr:hypothetical protein NLU13_5451 [Sarocladium strictum]